MKPQLKLAFMSGALFLGFLIADSSIAATYHVKKSGNDSHSCTQAQSASTPKLTISSALNCIGTGAGAGANHTVRVYAGTYAETINNNLPGGTSWNDPFTLESNPGDVVSIRPSGSCIITIDLRRSTTQYAIIQGHGDAKMVVDATNCSNNAIKITKSSSHGTAHHVRLKELEVRNAPNHGIQITSDSAFNEQINLWVHHNGSSANVDDTHGTYVGGADNLIEGGLYEHNYHRGIQIRAGTKTAHRNIIRRTIIRNNGRAPGGGGNVVLAAGDDIQFYNNIVYGATIHGVSVTCSGGCPSRTKIYNNTIFKNGQYAINLHGVSQTEIKNNIFWQNGSDTVALGPSIGTTQSNNLTSDPKFADVTKYNFRLVSGSPAIDKGATISAVKNDFDGRPRPQGASFDIGAFEFNATSGGSQPIPSPTPPAAPGQLTTVTQ